MGKMGKGCPFSHPEKVESETESLAIKGFVHFELEKTYKSDDQNFIISTRDSRNCYRASRPSQFCLSV